MDINGKKIYLTFDDGPHPTITPFVLDILKQYDAKATFFCIGNNVEKYPAVYELILEQGHSVGNHSFTHCNGYKTKDEQYLSDIEKAGHLIHSPLFRPPFGRLRSSQARQLKGHSIIMWDVLSGDFDESLNREKCLKQTLDATRPGSIIVFHDSDKAWQRVEYVLPRLMEKLKQRGYLFEKLTE